VEQLVEGFFYCKIMDKTKMLERVQKIIELLKSHFPPVAKEEDSQLQLTTAELIVSLSELDPDTVFEEIDMYQLMNDAGYTCQPVDEDERLVFKWLLGEG